MYYKYLFNSLLYLILLFPQLKQNGNYKYNVTVNKEPNCLFLHGSRGQEAKKAGAITNQLVTYTEVKHINPNLWGDMRLYTNCRKIYYNLSDTLHKPWDDPVLTKTYYNFAIGCRQVDQKSKCTQWLSVSDRPNKIFTHSMGTLILASFCQFHPKECKVFQDTKIKKVSWYNIQGPLTGTPIADQVDTWCNKKNGINYLLAKYYETCEYLNGELRTTINNRSLKPSYKSYLASGMLADITYNYLSGGICGNSAWGSTLMAESEPFDQVIFGLKINYLWAAATLDSNGNSFQHIDLSKTENDGFIPTNSCLGKHRSKFNSSYQTPFYLAKSNHIEGTASTPNSLLCSLGISQSYCIRLWYRERTRSVNIQ
ncbi:hypothetical protein NIES22_73480 (plasmid) [Calothrix brevissima NIES-22]|nr:hypothetical protein NIES22_73480 [Calothrix brevissima NIES-22]